MVAKKQNKKQITLDPTLPIWMHFVLFY